MKALVLLPMALAMVIAGCSSSKPKSGFKNGSWNEANPADKFTFGDMAKPKPKAKSDSKKKTE